MGSDRCFYRCGSRASSTQEYHVLPLSASTRIEVLDRGIVCDGCNAYFGQLENHFVQCHPGSSARLLYVSHTRKGKSPRFKTTRGEAIRRDLSTPCQLIYPLEDVAWERCANGDLRLIGTFRGPDFDARTISRLLVKIALEWLLKTMPEGSCYWPLHREYDELKRYARFGDTRIPFRWFAWKRTGVCQRV